jgi:alcohol dehydrogenase class IV
VLDVPGLREYGLQEEDAGRIAEKAKGASSMKGNPVKLTDEELVWILRKGL